MLVWVLFWCSLVVRCCSLLCVGLNVVMNFEIEFDRKLLFVLCNLVRVISLFCGVSVMMVWLGCMVLCISVVFCWGVVGRG